MTEETLELKRTVRSLDLAFLAGKKRQSPRTGFVHADDTIPIYENICYAFSLLSQKKGETVQEAKTLLSRLFAFQTVEGNFPIYLHDFPRSYDIYQGLKIAPLLLRMRLFKHVLGAECNASIEASLHKIFSFYADKTLAPLWKFRYDICREGCSNTQLDTAQFSASDWWEYWVSLQFVKMPVCDFYHPGLQMAVGFDLKQDRFEPAPRLIDWILVDGEYQPRLLKDHLAQIQLAALDRVEVSKNLLDDVYREDGDLFWMSGSTLHSLVSENISEGIAEFKPTFEITRDDLFEVAYYCDASPDIEISIDGKKGTVFALGQTIAIQSSTRSFFLKFELLRGEGEFCGHVFRSNRPGQIGTKGVNEYEAFDWKIGLRTLRRSFDCAVCVQLLQETSL